MHDLTLTDDEMEHVRQVTFHPQVHISHQLMEADVDEEIAPLILGLWERGIETDMSCIGTWPEDPVLQKWYRHIGKTSDDPAEIWIVFGMQDDLLAFLTIAAGEYNPDPESIYNRLCGDRCSTAGRWWVDVGPPLDANLLLDDEGEVTGKAWPNRGPDLVLWSWSVRFPHEDLDAVLTRVTPSQKFGGYVISSEASGLYVATVCAA